LIIFITFPLTNFGPRILALLATSFPGLKQFQLHAFDWGNDSDTLVYPTLHEQLNGLTAGFAEYRESFSFWNVQKVTVCVGGGRHPAGFSGIISEYVHVASMLREFLPITHCSWGVDTFALAL